MTKTLVEQQFGKSARHYADCEVHAKGASLGRLVTAVSPGSEWSVCDVATGAGHTAHLFARHVKSVVATDLTEEMLAETRRLAEDLGLPNVTTQRAAADRLPFEDGTLDLVTCRLAAHHFPDIGAFISESARVLKSGGLLAVVDNVTPDAESMPGLDADAIAAVAEAYNAFEKLRDPSHAEAWSVSAWHRTLEKHGLACKPVEVLVKEMAFTPWVERMHCDEGTVADLKRQLLAGDDLSEFLKPRADGDLWLSLREAIFVARKH